jgi:O-antigen/teichoic acid export membrane protein
MTMLSLREARPEQDLADLAAQVPPAFGAELAPQSVASSFGQVLSGRLVTATLAATSIVVITRTAPVATVGVYTAVTGYAALLAMFLDLGSGQGLVRDAELSADRESAIVRYIRTRTALTGATVLIGGLVALVLFPSDAYAAVLVGMAVVACSFVGILAAIGQVVGGVSAYRNGLILQSLLSTGGVVLLLFVADVREPAPLVGASAVAALIAAGYAFAWVRRTVGRLRSRVTLRQLLFHMRGLAILGLATGLSSVYNRLDGALLLRLGGSTEAAFYGVAYRMLDQAAVVPATLLVPLAPFLAVRLSNGRRLDAGATAWLFGLTRSLGMGLCVGFGATANFAVLLLAGPQYDVAAFYAVILAASLALVVAANVLVVGLIMAHHERAYLKIAAVSVAFNIALNVTFIPMFGGYACAVATAATETLVAVLAVLACDVYDRRLGLSTVGALVATACVVVGGKTALMAGADWLDLAGSVLAAVLAAAILARALRTLRRAPILISHPSPAMGA